MEKKRGVSLLETIVYVTLLALMLVIVVNTSISLNASFAVIRLSKGINTSAVTALERMTNEVKKAKSIDQISSVFGVNPSVLALSTTGDDGNPTAVLFWVDNGILRMKIGGVDIGALTASDVTVSNFIVTFIDAGRSGVATITLGLTGARGKITISDTLRTAAATRNQGI